MKRNTTDIDKKTREFVKQTALNSPGRDFTTNVMRQIEQEKVYGINRKDNNLLPILIAIILPLAYFVYQHFTNKGESFITTLMADFQQNTQFEFIKTFSERIIHQISVSPLIFMSILAIAILIAFDRLIIRILHT